MTLGAMAQADPPAGRRISAGSLFARFPQLPHLPGFKPGSGNARGRSGGKSLLTMDMVNWIPAFAGMTLWLTQGVEPWVALPRPSTGSG